MKRPLLASLVIVAAMFGLAPPGSGAAPANLVSNGSFDSTVAPWAGATWDPADAGGGAPSSGSARVVNDNNLSYPNADYATQCLNGIVVGESYRLSGAAFVAAGQGQNPGGGLGADGYSGPNCTGGWTGTISAATEGSGSWEALEASGTFPAGTQSAKILLQSSKRLPVVPSASTAVLFDNISFGLAAEPPPPSNYVPNGSFDHNVGGWTTSGALVDWDSGDATGNPASGSARGRNANAYTYDNHGYIERCIPAPPGGATYDFRGTIRVPPGQSEFIGAYLWLLMYAGPNCSGDELGNQSTQWVSASTWTVAATPVTVPPGAGSVKVVLAVARKGVPAGAPIVPVVAFFDDVSLAPASGHRLVAPGLAKD
ncbi:MAG: hypothetical protein HY875_03530 [Chloroflexi bacterium]|nr:hypothetical protein [Chloroflexota bacterium]